MPRLVVADHERVRRTLYTVQVNAPVYHYCEVEIEAETEAEANSLARDMIDNEDETLTDGDWELVDRRVDLTGAFIGGSWLVEDDGCDDE